MVIGVSLASMGLAVAPRQRSSSAITATIRKG